MAQTTQEASSDAAAAATSRSAVTADHKKLAFAFIRVLRSTDFGSGGDDDAAEVAVRAVADVFGIDAAGAGGVHDSDVDVLAAFTHALRERERRSGAEQDEKFATFVALLEKKGYFSGAEKGSDEYAQRLQRAREKFDRRNNPYEGLTAEQIKNKGNELMLQAKYKEAVAYYTKAIELEPENSVFFANRAAAHTHLQDYASAVNDCERAIVLNPSYSKSYSRLGTALFYQGNYARAVEAFGKACECDPANEVYKKDLQSAQEKLRQTSAASVAQQAAGTAGGGLGGMPGVGGMPDMSQFANMFANPQFMQMAQNMMQNPQFSSMVANLASSLGAGAAAGGGMPDPTQMFSAMRDQQPDAEGNISTPFGRVSLDALQRMQEEISSNPRLASVAADVRANGLSAMQRHMADPEVTEMMGKFTTLVHPPSGAGAEGDGDDA